MSVHELHIFVRCGEKTLKESLYSDGEFNEMIRFLHIFYPNMDLSLDNKKKIIDDFCKLYNKYRDNPSIIGDILEKPIIDEPVKEPIKK